jgi:hypothetical protein
VNCLPFPISLSFWVELVGACNSIVVKGSIVFSYSRFGGPLVLYTRVRRTGANLPVYREYRWYRWPPVPVCTGAYLLAFKIFEFEFEKLKNETKIPKNTCRFIESNGVKFLQT